MNLKKIRKCAARFFSWLWLVACSGIIKFIPERFLYGFASVVSFLTYCFAVKHKRIAFESLRIAFGQEKTDAEIEQIARDNFTYMAKSAAEFMFLMDKPLILKKRVTLEGRRNIDQALSGGCGAILVSAHFGNFPLLLGRLAADGYKIAGIIKPMHNLRIEKILLEKRNKCGIKTIYSQPRKVCVNETIRALRKNELIFIPIDQNFETGGVPVNFFGKKAFTATGPVILAQRTRAVLLPCFIVRQPDDTHKIIFEPAFTLAQGRNAQDNILINIQRLTDIIETYIREYPAQWNWIYRRWKRQPD